MTNDADLDAVEKRLKTYALETLANPDGSPAMGDIKAALQKAIEDELKPFVEDAKKTLATVQSELPGRLGQKLTNVEQALDQVAHRLDRMDRLLEHFANSVGMNVSTRQAPKRRRLRQPGWALPTLLAIAVIAAMLFAITQMASQLKQPNERDDGRGAVTEIADSPTAEDTPVERGWARVVADPGRREALCGRQEDCAHAGRDRPDQARALQAAMESLRQDFNCGGEPLGVDGDIGRGSLTAFQSIATCVAQSTDARCAENACRIPEGLNFDRLPTASWDEALNWALTILGATRESRQD